MDDSDKPVKSALAATSWALLGMMSYEEEVSGYDLKKWIDWSVDLYYWSPSYSQIYTELKKLEVLGLVTSRVERGEGIRSRRLYKITPPAWTPSLSGPTMRQSTRRCSSTACCYGSRSATSATPHG